ncbi:protein-export chaperone SecB [Litoreibacter arenae]|uniref:Protein-export protein SecB n=1 Tax=Litoreibacter arenae DSM 19593 TaxID=1123360 RepID=S9QCH7_9RHOB|nr:protein-export chaperone SecB [Litoreibacter arenae]EPX77627.1 Protein export cytoplasm chaperone protein, SecB [Litoreibacter arenae DSM 19593]
MAEENGAASAAPTPPRMQVLAQFIKDMSFENIAAQKGLGEGDQTPDIQVQVNLDAKKRGEENQFEVTTKLEVTAKTTGEGKPIFLMELEYTGIFHIENVPDEQLHPFLMIECPRMLFPFLRRIVSDVTRDGGFPPLNLETIDFLALYRNELARRAQAEAAAKTADA